MFEFQLKSSKDNIKKNSKHNLSSSWCFKQEVIEIHENALSLQKKNEFRIWEGQKNKAGQMIVISLVKAA